VNPYDAVPVIDRLRWAVVDAWDSVIAIFIFGGLLLWPYVKRRWLK
jgi:hypothetical protein